MYDDRDSVIQTGIQSNDNAEGIYYYDQANAANHVSASEAALRLRQKLIYTSYAGKLRTSNLIKNRSSSKLTAIHPYVRHTIDNSNRFSKTGNLLERLRQFELTHPTKFKQGKEHPVRRFSDNMVLTNDSSSKADFHECSVYQSDQLQLQPQLSIDYIAIAQKYKKHQVYKAKNVFVKCAMCQSRKATITFYPCEHCCICDLCFRGVKTHLKKCIVCGESIQCGHHIYRSWANEVIQFK